jgi:hypothetical protein
LLVWVRNGKKQPRCSRSPNWKTATQLPTNPGTRKCRPSTKHNPPLLFDLSNDLGETKNIAANHPEIVTRLLKEKETFAKTAAPNATTIKPPGGWQWDRPVPAHTKRIDHGLALTINAGRVWAGKNSRNRLLSKTPATLASIASADVELVAPHNKYADDDAFVKLVVDVYIRRPPLRCGRS